MANENFELSIKLAREAAIDSNLEQLEAWVSQAVAPYKDTTVTEENLKQASDDVAKLRKLDKALEDERKRLHEELEAPYKTWKVKYDSAVKELRETISLIGGQISTFQDAKKQAHIASRLEQWNIDAKSIGSIPLLEFVSKPEVKAWAWNPTWENITYSGLKFAQESRDVLNNINETLKVIDSREDHELLLEQYIETGNLAVSMQRVEAIKSAREQEEKARQARLAEKAEASSTTTTAPVTAKEEEKPVEKKEIIIDAVAKTMTTICGEESYVFQLDPAKHSLDTEESVCVRAIKGPKFLVTYALSVLKMLGLEIEKVEK